MLKKIILSFLVSFIVMVLYAQSYVPEKNNEYMLVKPAVDVKAYAFDLKDVRITGGPFKHAMDMDAA